MPRPGQKYILRVALPFREHARRFGFVALLVVSLGLVALGRTDVATVEGLRANIADISTPILSAVSRPIETARGVVRQVTAMAVLQQENQELRQQNSRLQRWQIVAHKLERENAALRTLMEYRPGPLASYISARLVGGLGSPFVRVLMLNAGARDGVKRGQAVLDSKGMVGRIVEVGKRSARVLLLTDLNSRIPIILEPSGDRAILAGDNSDTLHLELLSPKASITVGMRTSTSGHGGKLPPGLPIGRVSRISDGIVQVQPFVDFGRLDYVLVANWGTIAFESISDVDHPMDGTAKQEGILNQTGPGNQTQ